MSSLKEEREESEPEEMERDSADSDKSSSTSESSDGSDTDDSSELDLDECERRRNECIENLAEMERQFAILRELGPVSTTSQRGLGAGGGRGVAGRSPVVSEQGLTAPSLSVGHHLQPLILYKERIAQIKEKLEEVEEGVAKEYLVPLEELQDSMRVRIQVAGILKKLRLENIENSFKAEEQAARQNFENEKVLLFDSLKEDLEDRIRRLEEEKTNVDFQSEPFFEKAKSGSGKGSRSGWRKGTRPEPSRRKPVTVSGPYIVYMLSDAEILEDWTVIKKALQSSSRTVERKPAFHRFHI